MKTTIDWLDAAKQQHDLSDYALAPLLGVTRSQLSRYRKGHDYLSDDAAIKLAELLGMDDPSLIIASAHAERAKSPAAKAFWERWAAVAAGVVFAVGLGSSPAPAAAQSQSLKSGSLYIMFNRRKTRSYHKCRGVNRQKTLRVSPC